MVAGKIHQVEITQTLELVIAQLNGLAGGVCRSNRIKGGQIEVTAISHCSINEARDLIGGAIETQRTFRQIATTVAAEVALQTCILGNRELREIRLNLGLRQDGCCFCSVRALDSEGINQAKVISIRRGSCQSEDKVIDGFFAINNTNQIAGEAHVGVQQRVQLSQLCNRDISALIQSRICRHISSRDIGNR